MGNCSLGVGSSPSPTHLQLILLKIHQITSWHWGRRGVLRSEGAGDRVGGIESHMGGSGL